VSRRPSQRRGPPSSGAEGARGPGRGGAGNADRVRALRLLIEAERGAFVSGLFDARDGSFVRELVLGVLRRRLTLDCVLDAFGRRPLEDLDDDVRAALRLGLYQLLFMDGVPPHAAVAETVGALRASGASSGAAARGYVNAVLRAVQRGSHRVPEHEDRGGASPRKRLHRPGRCVVFFSRPVFPDPEPEPGTRGAAGARAAWLAAVHSHPPALVERWLAEVGEAAAVARMEAGNAPAPVVLRPRLARAATPATAAGARPAAHALAEQLLREGVVTELVPRPGGATDALAVRSGAGRALGSAAFRDGLFVVQDPAQMDAAEILAPRAGEVVWDACAAPGGKTAQLAELLELAERAAAAAAGAGADEGVGPGGGRIVATDVSPVRLLNVHEAVARLALPRVEVARHGVLAAGVPPGRPERGFDAILIDAPCSNTAVLARRPEARWRFRTETVLVLAAIQRGVLAAAYRHLAPDGRLVYSVCTHEPEEGAGHGLRATRSPFVWTATHAELGALVAAWKRDGLLAASGASGASAADAEAGAAADADADAAAAGDADLDASAGPPAERAP
jgi:16S rRNA (cytosine967-C5)-methyltransferase